MPNFLRALLRPPDDMSPGEGKIFRVRIALCLLPSVFHVAQVGIFAALGMGLFGLWSLISLVWFAGCIALVRAGRGRTAVLGLWLEVATHSTVLTFVFGPGAGYHLYGFALIMAPFLLFAAHDVAHRVAMVAVSVALAIMLFEAGPYIHPVWPIDEDLTRWLMRVNMLGTATGLAGAAAWFSRNSELAERSLDAERIRSERLLLNVLPASIAAELKEGRDPIADHYEEVSVLFADIVGFTQLSAKLSTAEIIEMLNRLFTDFDDLADALQLEKIKTIGDAYMVVGGLPEPHADHAGAMAEFALGMRAAVARYVGEGGHPIELRIGIHAGPVVAGVIGKRKFAYDLWGDTVNTASRMESHGAPGRIAVSDAYRTVLQDRFAFEDRGLITIKSKGQMRTWFLEAR